MQCSKIHHLHFNAAEPLTAAQWYAEHLGMRAVQVDSSLAAALLPGDSQHAPATLLWSQADAVGSSVGTTSDHFGWSVVDLDAETKRLQAAGCELISEPVTIGPSSTGESLRISFLMDPFGAKLELVADDDLLGFHHVHLMSPDVEADQAQWLACFGGAASLFKGFLPGIRYANGWVLFRPTDEPLLATSGRAIDHLALQVDSTEAALRHLAAQGIAVSDKQASHGGRTVGFSQLSTGASGAVTVELVQEPVAADSTERA